MRELTVYYCSKCGRYGFYQVSKNAICPVCKTPMTVFPMSYQNFMDMDYNIARFEHWNQIIKNNGLEK